MFASYLTVVAITIVANVWATAADLRPASFVLANMAEVGVPRSWLGPLGVLKGAAAAGLLIGLLGVRPLGIAAAAGLVLFFTGALVTHVHARVLHNIGFPGAYWVLAAASLALMAAR